MVRVSSFQRIVWCSLGPPIVFKRLSARLALEAIEQFLCGELLTKLESRRLGNLEDRRRPRVWMSAFASVFVSIRL